MCLEGCVLEQQGVQGCDLDSREYRGVSRGVCLRTAGSTGLCLR